MYLQLAEGENNGNYAALAENGGVMDMYVFIPAGFLPEFEKDTYVRADYFNKYDPTTAEALINALAAQQTVGLSVVGVAAASTALTLAKKLVENRKAKVEAGTAKPLFKPGGVFDKLKTALKKETAPTPQQKTMNLPEQPVGASVTLPSGSFDVDFIPKDDKDKNKDKFKKFLEEYKTPLLIGGGLLAAGLVYMAMKKKK